MKIPYPLVLLFTSCFGNNDIKSRPADMEAEKLSASSFYDFRIPSLDGDTIDFSRFRGKKVLIVNTASKCGYTPQYAELQKLHEKYKDKIVVLGFPSNDFKNQEPAGNKEIREFCTRNYGVTFPMSEKITVKGEKKQVEYTRAHLELL
jgi:glutathione peroxidase